jgi:hypothetical protein
MISIYEQMRSYTLKGFCVFSRSCCHFSYNIIPSCSNDDTVKSQNPTHASPNKEVALRLFASSRVSSTHSSIQPNSQNPSTKKEPTKRS